MSRKRTFPPSGPWIAANGAWEIRFLWWLTELLARKEPSACMWSAKGDVLICRDAWQHRQLTWFTGGGRLVVSQSARILLTLFSRWASEDREEKTQTSEPGARSPTYEMRNASCRTLRESPDKKFVFYHKFPPLNYSCAAIIFYILFDSRESVGVKTVLWSWGNVGRRLRRRVKKLAVARRALIARSHCLTIARDSSFFFSLSLRKQADNTKWQPISLWYMTSSSLRLCTAPLRKMCWRH